MKFPTKNTMLPFLNTLFLLLILMPIISQSLTIKLIPPSSSESPFYMGKLSFWDKTRHLAKQSKSRAIYLSNKLRGFAHETKLAHPPVSFEQGLYVIKLGIGTFQGKTPSYKSYYLQMDTGSNIIWLQCDDCKRDHQCMPQKGEAPFPCHLSKTCHPIKCERQGHIASCDDDNTEYCDKQNTCRYVISYADKTFTLGFTAHETFTFEGQNANKPAVVVQGIRFGCGVNQAHMNVTGEPDNRVAGLVGLSWSPRSLHTQLDSISDSKFSYCLPPIDASTDHKTYLSFGADVEEMITPGIRRTSMMMKDTAYWVLVKDISLNNKRLKVPLGSSFRFGVDEGKAVIVDSGTIVSRLPKPMFDVIERAMSKLLSHDPNLVRVLDEDYDLCYVRKRPERHAYAGLPNMTFHLNGADFEVGPRGLFAIGKDDKGKQEFCLFIIPTGEDGQAILGAFQQVNQRIIFDPKRSRLLFKPEVC